jgi:hypothetical protein
LFDTAIEWVRTQVHRLLDAVRHRSEALTDTLREWMNALIDDITAGSPGLSAALGALRAVLSGKNPVWAAIKGLVSGLSAGGKVLLVLVVILAILLLPVVVLVLLLALLVVAVIVAVRSSGE